jgi:hypothetical protein
VTKDSTHRCSVAAWAEITVHFVHDFKQGPGSSIDHAERNEFKDALTGYVYTNDMGVYILESDFTTEYGLGRGPLSRKGVTRGGFRGINVCSLRILMWTYSSYL